MRDWVLLQFCIWAQGRNWFWWYYKRVCLSEGYTSRPLLVTSLPCLFSRKYCTLPITLEIGKINNLITVFSFAFIYWECPAENTGDGISETLNFKIFSGSIPPDPPGLGRLRRVNFPPACTYRYLYIAHEINAQGWKKGLGLEGVGRGGSGGDTF